MNTIKSLETILDDAHAYFRKCRDWKIYEYLKQRLDRLNLSPEIYEQAIKKITEEIGV